MSKKHTKWEYHVSYWMDLNELEEGEIFNALELQESMNEDGLDGWELVCQFWVEKGIYFILKRPIK